jgi:hypothetical protein
VREGVRKWWRWGERTQKKRYMQAHIAGAQVSTSIGSSQSEPHTAPAVRRPGCRMARPRAVDRPGHVPKQPTRAPSTAVPARRHPRAAPCTLVAVRRPSLALAGAPQPGGAHSRSPRWAGRHPRLSPGGARQRRGHVTAVTVHAMNRTRRSLRPAVQPRTWPPHTHTRGLGHLGRTRRRRPAGALGLRGCHAGGGGGVTAGRWTGGA